MPTLAHDMVEPADLELSRFDKDLQDFLYDSCLTHKTEEFYTQLHVVSMQVMLNRILQPSTPADCTSASYNMGLIRISAFASRGFDSPIDVPRSLPSFLAHTTGFGALDG